MLLPDFDRHHNKSPAHDAEALVMIQVPQGQDLQAECTPVRAAAYHLVVSSKSSVWHRHAILWMLFHLMLETGTAKVWRMLVRNVVALLRMDVPLLINLSNNLVLLP